MLRATETVTSPRRRIRIALVHQALLITNISIKISINNKLRREEAMINTIQYNTGTMSTIRTAKSVFFTHVRRIWPGGRQYAGDAATQLLCIIFVFLGFEAIAAFRSVALSLL